MSILRHEFVVLQGAFRERLFGTTVDHGPGSVVVRDAHQPHSDRYGSAGGLYVRIAFEDSALAASLPAPTRHPRIIPAVDALAANLRNEIQRSDGWSALASHGVALELLATLGRHDRPERSRPPWVHVVCEALHDDPSRPWSLTELGHLVDVDPVRLSRTFRRCIRMSVGSYLRTLRVHEAKRQIERSRNTLSKIAVDLGFSDQSHLNRAFREAFGLSAGAHRMRAASTIAAFNRPICLARSTPACDNQPMRHLVIASIAAIGVLASQLSVGAQASIRGPIADLRQASGCAGWRHIAALHFAGANRADGLSGPIEEVLDAQTGRFIRSGTEGGFTWAIGFDGATAWERDFSGASHPFDAPSARARARTDAWLARRGWCHDGAEGAQVHLEHSHVERGRTFDVLSVVPRGGSPVEMWIDRRTHLLDRIEERLNESHLIEHFDDWRTVAGMAFPFVLRDEYPEDEDSETYTLRAVTQRHEPRSSAFAQPSAPHDVVMLHGASMTRVPYVLEGQKPIIEVLLNGIGPFPFVLDTGAHFILTPATVHRIGVSPRGGANSTGQGNAILRTGFTRVRTLRIGDAVIANDVAKVVPYHFRRLERGPRPPKAGWLGLSLFERFAVTIDPVSRTVTLRPLGRARPRPPGVRIPLNFDEDAPLIACSVDKHRGPCMVDTGNAGSTIVEGYWAQRNGLASRLNRGVPIGDGITVSRATLGFGPIRSPHELVEYQPRAQRGSEATTVEAAILSEGLIDRYTTTIDYDRHAMWVKPIPHPYTRPFNRSGIEADKEKDGTFIVWRVMPNSPAYGAGIRVGTRILGVDGIAARDLAGTDFSDLSQGPVGTVRTFRVADGPGMRIVTLRLRELLP